MTASLFYTYRFYIYTLGQLMLIIQPPYRPHYAFWRSIRSICSVWAHNPKTEHTDRVPMIPGKSLKVLDFGGQISSPWKVLENDFGPWKSWKLHLMVLKSIQKTVLTVGVIDLLLEQQNTRRTVPLYLRTVWRCINAGCVQSWNLKQLFPGLESHGIRPRSWKVM